MAKKDRYKLRDRVYLVTDIDQLARIVVARTERETGWLYELGQGAGSSWHYSFEMSREKQVKPSAGFQK